MSKSSSPFQMNSEDASSDRQFRMLINSVRDYAIFMLDPNGVIQTWNAGGQLMKGYAPEEIIGQHFSKFYTAEDIENDHPGRELLLARWMGRYEEEGWRVRKDGTRFWAKVVITASHDENGELIGFSKITQDLTERTRAEERLIHSYEHLTNSIPQLVWTADPKGLLVSANERWHKYTGLTEEESHQLDPFHLFHPDEKAAFSEQYQQAIAAASELSIEHRMRRHDGEYRWFLTRATPSKSLEAQIWAWFGTSTDIHEQKMVSEELQRAKVQAEQANHAKSSFLANMSHEIRTPLGAILGFAELMGDEDQSLNERMDCIETIKRNGAVLSKVINEILDLSKIESQKLELDYSEFDLVELIQDVRVLLDLQAQEKGLRLKLSLSPELPRQVICDPTRLRQILFNIVGNAVKFSERGEILVQVQSLPLENETGFCAIEFEITDHGPGVSEDQVANIFEPFVQADNSMTRKHGGTGLGLSIARKLARAMGGDLCLTRSALDQGSTFQFTVKVRLPGF